ncbi:hypothetical protein BLL52_4268 [Rhodoferax antarcticus ANT.BR]|uniref:Uncharacterized protein n=2 Tax=Rhodoferax antarcticus TaxID=81479 RepID=A0A1Q8Y9S9_9BURK|nr:hypothetical protein BLL52_4268 [Rhodoferax antarcticus ANT.BR]
MRFFVGISDDAVVDRSIDAAHKLVDILHGEELRWYTLNPSATRAAYKKAAEADFDLSGEDGNG